MVGRVITIAQRKGGAGKTTLAAQLAVAWARQGAKIAVLDIDPQASLSGWVALRRTRLGAAGIGFDFAALPGWRAEQWIAEHVREADLVLVDGPAHIEAEARIAVRAAALVLIPVQPSPLDLWATEATLAMARDEGRQILAVLNRVASRSAVAEQIAAGLAEAGAKLATARIGNRIALVHAMAQGLGVLESAAASPAAAEIAALAQEIGAL